MSLLDDEVLIMLGKLNELVLIKTKSLNQMIFEIIR